MKYERESFEDANTRMGLSDQITYLDVLLEDVTEFDALIRSDASDEVKRDAFKQLMTHTLGDINRRNKFIDKFGCGRTTVLRYMQRKSSPHKMMYPAVVEILNEILTIEKIAIQKQLQPLKDAKEARDQAYQKETDELVERILHIVPDTSFNEIATFELESSIEDQYGAKLWISHKCRGVYPLSDSMPLYCTDECRDHGHLILGSEDGLTLLPHQIRSQADILQAIADIESQQVIDCYYDKSEVSTWYAGCRELLKTDEAVLNLPVGNTERSKSHDMSKMGWWFC